MRAIVEINGWRKEIEITQSAMRSGYVAVGVCPPAPVGVPTEEAVDKSTIRRYDCRIQPGKSVNGLPLFVADT